MLRGEVRATSTAHTVFYISFLSDIKRYFKDFVPFNMRNTVWFVSYSSESLQNLNEGFHALMRQLNKNFSS